VAVKLALWIPLLAALISLPRLVIGTAQGRAAFLAEDWRLWVYVVAPAVFALIVMYVTSLYAAWLAGPSRLPRVVRTAVEMSRAEPLPEVGLARHATSLPEFARIRLALRTIAEASILLFLAVPLPAILLGYLFQPGTLRTTEAVIVGMCAAAEIGWLAFVVYRYLATRRTA
jgi:hypothetical protein